MFGFRFLFENRMATLKPSAKPIDPTHPKDSFREIIETIVFVVALVLMLKLFIVEAFVIPTGSMAETLYGYQKMATCPDCGHNYPVNCSDEVEPQNGATRLITGARCPNCGYHWEWTAAERPSYRSGDRVLVHKALYNFTDPKRGDVVVFKFPVDPQLNHTAQNYIKRLSGLGGETIAIYRGDLYVCNSLQYPEDARDSFNELLYPRPKAEDRDRIWEGPEVNRLSRTQPPYISLGIDFTYHNKPAPLALFDASRQRGFTPTAAGGFELIRKSDDMAMSMRRIVYDNENQSQFLQKKGVPARWQAETGNWKSDKPETPKVFTHTGDDTNWVRYRHRMATTRDDWKRVEGGYQEGLFPSTLITNFLGYNSYEEGGEMVRQNNGDRWVGDLMIECAAKVSGPSDEVILELSKGMHRFQARFAGGQVKLISVGPGGKELASQPTKMTAGGTYDLRFANFDSRLRVWVNGTRIDFGTAGDVPPWDTTGYDQALGAIASAIFAPTPSESNDGMPLMNLGAKGIGATVHNDIAAPASLGAKGNIEFSKIKLWQDTFFTPGEDYRSNYLNAADPVDTYYVQPGHYLCLGDNSGQSSDSRKWGLVPERLMLGKAQFVFFPRTRIGFIK